MRRLIINADDFGLTPGVNRGIAECGRTGVVTSTTVMVNAGAFEDALHTVRGMNAISVGCHVVLVDGAPVLPPEKVRTLVPDSRREFRDRLSAFARAALGGKISADEIEAETAAQIRKLQNAGIRPSHLDTHKHVHLFPTVLKPVLRAARACGVRAVRTPFAPVKPLAFAHLLRRPHLWKRYTEVRLLRGWNESFRRLVAAEDMATTDGTFGIVSTGALDLKLFRAIVGCIPEGTWEFCCHPGYSDGLEHVRTRLRSSRDRERQVLTSPAAREILEQYGVELISYWDVQ